MICISRLRSKILPVCFRYSVPSFRCFYCQWSLSRFNLIELYLCYLPYVFSSIHLLDNTLARLRSRVGKITMKRRPKYGEINQRTVTKNDLQVFFRLLYFDYDSDSDILVRTQTNGRSWNPVLRTIQSQASGECNARCCFTSVQPPEWGIAQAPKKRTFKKHSGNRPGENAGILVLTILTRKQAI